MLLQQVLKNAKIPIEMIANLKSGVYFVVAEGNSVSVVVR